LHLRSNKCTPPPTIHATNETPNMGQFLNQDQEHDSSSTESPEIIPASVPPDPPPPLFVPDPEKANQTKFNFKWGSYDGESFARKVDLVCEEIVFWKKNLFLLSKGAAGKGYI